MLLHVIHMREVFNGQKATQFNINPGWAATYEMDPNDSLSAFVQRCTEKQNMEVEILFFLPELTAEQVKWK